MSDSAHAVHVAITRRVRPGRVAEFEAALAEFAGATMSVPGMRGVHCLYPPPGAAESTESAEYGILRSFASEAARDAFYASPVYRAWEKKVASMTEGEAIYRNLDGLEVWFHTAHGPMPPRWKMALLTWLAVWPVSMGVASIVLPLISLRLHPILVSGVVSAGIVLVLTWAAMPLMVRIAHGWLHPSSPPVSSQAHTKSP
jgi:antibiotic biosynthesis monooxygenase (ABM) superfamily enzyme